MSGVCMGGRQRAHRGVRSPVERRSLHGEPAGQKEGPAPDGDAGGRKSLRGDPGG